MMKKEKYETPDVNVEKYDSVDILTNSDGFENGNTNGSMDP